VNQFRFVYADIAIAGTSISIRISAFSYHHPNPKNADRAPALKKLDYALLGKNQQELYICSAIKPRCNTFFKKYFIYRTDKNRKISKL
jgi:hypothetical protein